MLKIGIYVSRHIKGFNDPEASNLPRQHKTLTYHPQKSAGLLLLFLGIFSVCSIWIVSTSLSSCRWSVALADLLPQAATAHRVTQRQPRVLRFASWLFWVTCCFYDLACCSPCKYNATDGAEQKVMHEWKTFVPAFARVLESFHMRLVARCVPGGMEASSFLILLHVTSHHFTA